MHLTNKRLLGKNKIFSLYQELQSKHGSKLYNQFQQPQGQWTLWCKKPKTISDKEEVVIGSILTQHTNWKNVDKAIECLKQARKYSLKSLVDLGEQSLDHLRQLIKASRFYKTKADYLLGIAEFFIKRGGVTKIAQLTIREARQQLLQLKGIGPETADSILLYALEKPIFVIDEYTRRLVKRKKLTKKLTYDHLQKLFERNLPVDVVLYQNFHALIVIENQTKEL